MSTKQEGLQEINLPPLPPAPPHTPEVQQVVVVGFEPAIPTAPVSAGTTTKSTPHRNKRKADEIADSEDEVGEEEEEELVEQQYLPSDDNDFDIDSVDDEVEIFNQAAAGLY